MGGRRSDGPLTDRRQALIDAARPLFAQRPYYKVTTTEIARAAGVAYGLIAHHFDNKHGLYLAVMNEIATEIAAVHLSVPQHDAPPADRLRHALRAHIEYIDSYSESFVAFVRGSLGPDPDRQAVVEQLRWLGAQRILLSVGIAEPVSPTLRTAMRGWVGYLDEMMIDRITNRDLDVDVLVELAAAALVTTLLSATRLDSSTTLASSVRDALDGFTIE
jgi:AcrR family transcriptional regulator